MKISPREAELFLSAPDKKCRALLLYGPDAGLVRQRSLKVKAAVLAKGSDPFAFVELSEAALLNDPARLSDEIAAIGLMGGKRLILASAVSDKLAGLIEGASPALHDDVFLLVVAGELSPRSSLRAWFEAWPAAAAIACYRDEARDVQSVVQKYFSEAGISAPREAVDYLCSQLGNDREVTCRELEKLITFAGEGKTLSLEEARALVDYNRETELDDIVFAAADRSLKALDQMLALHIREGAPAVSYIRSLSRYFQRLYYVKSQAEAGRDIEAVVQSLKPKVFFRHVPLMVRHARNWSLPSIIRALKLLAAAEVEAKSSDFPTAVSARRLYQIAQAR